MADINVVSGNAPASAEKAASFEIVIRTRDPYYIEHGGPEELVIPCDGYFLYTYDGESQGTHGQGRINTMSLVQSVLKHAEPEAVLAACIAQALHDGENGE